MKQAGPAVLELKVPPPVVAILIALAMWLLSFKLSPLHLAPAVRVGLAMVLSLVSGGFSIGGILECRRARTTVNPHKPARATSLVTTGVYRITRNPMYLGLAFLLVAWAVALSAPLLLVGPLAFVLYIGRFQIQPEERILTKLFGADYTRYASRVRRWL